MLLLGVLLGLKTFSNSIRECSPIFGVFSSVLLPLSVVTCIFLVTALGGLAEPTGDMNNDAVAYHYLGPKVWLRDAMIRPVPDEAQTSFPSIIETQYAALMALGGQRAPQFFAVAGLLSLLLVAVSLALRVGPSSWGAWWVAALIVTMPAVYRGAYGGFIDALYAGFVLAGARIAFDAERPQEYVLFGLFCGIAAGTKYTGLIAWVVLLFCVLVIAVRIRKVKLATALEHF